MFVAARTWDGFLAPFPTAKRIGFVTMCVDPNHAIPFNACMKTQSISETVNLQELSSQRVIQESNR